MESLSKLLICAAGVTAGAAGVEVFHRSGPPAVVAGAEPAPPGIAPAPAPPAPPVEPSSAIAFEGIADVPDDRVARVTFKEGERVFEVAVRPGQTVQPGDLLFTLKGVHLQQIEQAAGEAVASKKKRLTGAEDLAAEKRRVADQLRQLQTSGAATADEVKRADSDAVQAARAVEFHQAQLREQQLVHASAKSVANDEYVTLPEGYRFPAGVVRRVTITPGDMRRGTAFQGVEVANLDQLQVRAVLSPAQRRALAAARRKGETFNAVVTLDGAEYPAALAPPEVEADPATGAVATVVTIENTREPRLPAGARVAVRITAE